MARNLLNKVIVFLNAFSVWVALGAYWCFLFAQQFARQEIDYFGALILALSVWLIYTADHYLDGMKLGENQSMPRHYLHKKYAKTVLTTAVLVLLIDVVLAYQYLNIQYLVFGIILLGATAIHFIINFLVPIKLVKMLYLKEFFVAVVVACAYTVLPLKKVNLSLEEIQLFLFFVCLNSANLLLFSWYDADEEPTVLSLPNVYGKNVTLRLAGICLGLASVLVGLIYVYAPQENSLSSALILSSMVFLTALLLLSPNLLKKNGLYRFLGDAIYVLPVLAFL